MWQLTFIIFIRAFCIFAGIMFREPRTLWSGVSFFRMLMWLALFVLFFFSQYSNWLAEHKVVLSLMAMYALSAILNLIHLKKKRRLNYIVVLGCGIRGRGDSGKRSYGRLCSSKRLEPRQNGNLP